MRYYVGQCEYKWTHKNTKMERLWIQREVGVDLFKTVEQNDWEMTLLRTGSRSLPSDIYCRTDVYVEIPDSKQGTIFALKFPQAKPVPLAK